MRLKIKGWVGGWVGGSPQEEYGVPEGSPDELWPSMFHTNSKRRTHSFSRIFQINIMCATSQNIPLQIPHNISCALHFQHFPVESCYSLATKLDYLLLGRSPPKNCKNDLDDQT